MSSVTPRYTVKMNPALLDGSEALQQALQDQQDPFDRISIAAERATQSLPVAGTTFDFFLIRSVQTGQLRSVIPYKGEEHYKAAADVARVARKQFAPLTPLFDRRTMLRIELTVELDLEGQSQSSDAEQDKDDTGNAVENSQ